MKAVGDTEPDWVKLGKAGWVMRKHIDSLTREHNITTKYTCVPGAENASRENPKKFTVTTSGLLERYEAIETPSKADSDMLVALASAASGDIPVQVAPRRYSIAKYMRQYLKGDIDFFIADECHELKGDTEQGEAFGDFVRTARKSLGLATGLNLLDFTTIVFYEIDYNLYTFRQASRRSWRLNQENDIEVYLLYYRETVQEACISLMAEKLKAAMAIEGKFSEEGMAAMANNNDILTQIASSVTNDIKETVDVKGFEKLSKSGRQDNERHAAETHLIDMPRRRLVTEYEPGTVLAKRKLNYNSLCVFLLTFNIYSSNPLKHL